MGNEKEFAGQVVVVTGGAEGIGLATARRFAQRGAGTVLVDIDDEKGNAEADRMKNDGGKVLYVHADVTNNEEIKKMADKVMMSYGRVDILINNAGGFTVARPFLEIGEEEWRKMIDLNLTSAFLCSQALVPHMLKGERGRIVNVASMAGQTAQQPAPAYYSAGKAGVLGLTRILALELGPFNITVNAVAPSTTRTPRVDKVRGSDVYDALEARTPVRRIGRPEDMASAILFLASEEASFITGAVIDVNGGRFMA